MNLTLNEARTDPFTFGTATVQKFGHTATRNTNNIYTTLQ